MRAVFIKEFNAFFSSLTGYMALVVFFLLCGLLLWVFPQTSILDYGYATLEPFFEFVPWVLMFLISAVTMRAFAEEKRTQTIELMLTRPVREWEVVVGKWLAAMAVVTVALLFTVVYVGLVWWLASPRGNIDVGAVVGSYVGLLLLSGVFTSVGVFASSLTASQPVAFLLSLFLCFFFYEGFSLLARLPVFFGKVDWIVELVGIHAHYREVAGGVISLRDVVYFMSVCWFWLFCTVLVVERRR